MSGNLTQATFQRALLDILTGDSVPALLSPAGVLYDSFTLRDNASVSSATLNITRYDQPRTDDATGRDTDDCSTSSGGRWSDLMAQIDDLIGDPEA